MQVRFWKWNNDNRVFPNLTGKYPIVYVKASDIRKIKMLNDFLEQDIDWEDDDYVRKKALKYGEVCPSMANRAEPSS
jgi:hypothetical protein